MKNLMVTFIACLSLMFTSGALASHHQCCDYDNDYVYDHIKTRCVEYNKHPDYRFRHGWDHHHGHGFHLHGGVLAPVDYVLTSFRGTLSGDYHKHQPRRNHHMSQHNMKCHHMRCHHKKYHHMKCQCHKMKYYHHRHCHKTCY